MTDYGIKKVAFSRGDGRCPVCKKMISQKKHFYIELHDFNRKISTEQRCELLYCDHCDIPLVDGKIVSLIIAQTGLRPITFSTKTNKLAEVKKQMHCSTTPFASLSQQSRNKGYRVIGKVTSIWKPYTRLYPSDRQAVCPTCNQQLIKDETVIPISECSNLLVEGFYCYKCRSLFVRNADEIAAKLKDNPYSKGFYINDIAYWQYSETERRKKQEERKHRKIEESRAKEAFQRQRKKSILDSIESSVVLISVIFQNKNPAEYIITTKDNSVAGENVIQYATPIGRELLAAAYAKARNKCGSLNGQNYRVCSVFPTDEIPRNLIPSAILVKKDGGYISSIKNNKYEIVDLLLYSPKTKIYECTHATYSKEEDICYMDISIYRNFVKRFGNPGLFLEFPSKSCTTSELNEESVLKGYGYSVSKSDNLSTPERRELLTEIVDLKILPVSRIVYHLDFCIRLHTDPQHAEAVNKWISDRCFIANYKANPTRFLIFK